MTDQSPEPKGPRQPHQRGRSEDRPTHPDHPAHPDKPDHPENGKPDNSPFKPTWYVYDQFSFDPLAEFRFPNKEVQLRRIQTVGSQISKLYSREIFSGETPEDPLPGEDPKQLGRYAYFYTNHRYDTSSILKHSGQSLHSYLYDEYGMMYDNNKKPRDASNFTQFHNYYTFSQKEFDPESQLSYFGARSYDVFSGTWTTQDIYRGAITDPSSLHRYAFVENNPINFIDQFGFSHEKLSSESPLPGNDQFLTNPLDYFLFPLVEGVANSTPRFSFLSSVLLTAKTFLDQLQPSLDIRPPKPGERLQRKTVFIPQSPESTAVVSTRLVAGGASGSWSVPEEKKQNWFNFILGVQAVQAPGISPSDQCASALSKIMRVAEEIAGRQQDLLVDQHNLFENYRWESNPHPQHGSYQGHQRQMEEQQGRLEKLKDRYNKIGCPDPPEGLPNAELLPVPLRPERATQVAPNISPAEVVVGGAAVAGLGYLIYRGLRLLPSLIPPLWPTLPLNLATP